MIESLPGLREKIPGIHVIHQTGQRDYDHVLAAYGSRNLSEVHKFIDDMPGTFGRADWLVCHRAQARSARSRRQASRRFLCPSRPPPMTIKT